MWSVVEVCVAIVCACLPTYRPLFDPKVRRNKNQTSVVEVVDTGRRPFSMEKPFGKGNHCIESKDVELLHYPSLTIDERQILNESAQADPRNDFLTVVHGNWHAETYERV